MPVARELAGPRHSKLDDLRSAGLLVQAIEAGSELASVGLRAGDRIVALDSYAPRDLIDLQFDLPGARSLTVLREDELYTLSLRERGGDASALTLRDPVPGGIRECNNHCEFCFIRGLPRGLRETLYVFDDDYRYSFLWGNFLTLTNLTEDDWQRIGFQRLSPLNVSVHATDPAIRSRMLNHRDAPPVVPLLRRLAVLGIEVHTQVVLCGGLNDGAVLSETVHELANLYPSVRTLSVVPVGLTRFSRVGKIRRPSPPEAQIALSACEAWQNEMRARIGVGFVYPSDELYLLAGRGELPPSSAYDGFPVTSNGVGVTRGLLDEFQRALRRRHRKPRQRSVALLTGRLAAPALERISDLWAAYAGWPLNIVPVENAFFGSDIGASGLLSGADLRQTLRSLGPGFDDVILPRAAFGFDGNQTLDGITAEELGSSYPSRVHLALGPGDVLAILFRV